MVSRVPMLGTGVEVSHPRRVPLATWCAASRVGRARGGPAPGSAETLFNNVMIYELVVLIFENR